MSNQTEAMKISRNIQSSPAGMAQQVRTAPPTRCEGFPVDAPILKTASLLKTITLRKAIMSFKDP
jgi:hypothetical protein